MLQVDTGSGDRMPKMTNQDLTLIVGSFILPLILAGLFIAAWGNVREEWRRHVAVLVLALLPGTTLTLWIVFSLRLSDG
jgi:hypothetical protein